MSTEIDDPKQGDRMQSRHLTSGMGYPEGGWAHGEGFAIVWESASMSDVAAAILDRLRYLEQNQADRVRCGLSSGFQDYRQEIQAMENAVQLLSR